MASDNLAELINLEANDKSHAICAQSDLKFVLIIIRDFFRKIFILIIDTVIKRDSGIYNMTEINELRSFIKFLKDECNFDFNLNVFDHRFRLQKYVFLAKCFGWHNDYLYGVYLRGPYSSDLATHYYKFKKININSLPLVELSTFDKTAFLNLVNNKDDSWLESATTIISIMDNYRRYYSKDELNKRVLERVFDLKDYIPSEIIVGAFSDLIDAKILPII